MGNNVEGMCDESQDRLHSLEEELFIYRSILDQMPDYAVMVIDKYNKVLLYNKLSSIYDDIPQPVVEGKSVNQIMMNPKDDSLQEVMRTGTAKYNYTNTYHLKNSKTVSIYGNCFPIRKDGEVIASCSIVKRQKELQSHLNELRELQTRIEAVNRKDYNGTRYQLDDIIGNSEVMRIVKEKCYQAALLNRPILLYGETGTGKELFAQSIHNISSPSEPFLAINCAAVPETLIESILFGTTKGAFTGAEFRKGLFEQAGEGTLFLDEINSMPLQLQSKLLRVLQEKSVRRLGGEKEIPVCCRIISSCNKKPKECVKEGTLRDDLYYRIAAITINIPPLKERGNDIIELAEFYRIRFEQDVNWPAHSFTEKAKRQMLRYDWPGNVRELQYVVENILLMSKDKLEIAEMGLPGERIQKKEKQKEWDDSDESEDLETFLLEVERKKILQVLEDTKWNMTMAADKVGYTRQKLQYRMKKLNII